MIVLSGLVEASRFDLLRVLGEDRFVAFAISGFALDSLNFVVLTCLFSVDVEELLVDLCSASSSARLFSPFLN